jgi:hypothetical protein
MSNQLHIFPVFQDCKLWKPAVATGPGRLCHLVQEIIAFAESLLA